MNCRVVQINTHDIHGGAAAVAKGLHERYRERGMNSQLWTGFKQSENEGIIELRKNSYWASSCERVRQWAFQNRIPVIGGVFNRLGILDPKELNRRRLLATGHEDVVFRPIPLRLFLKPEPPGIVHLHNLHGYYFHFAQLAAISRQYKTCITLHDAWLMTGHCAHAINCDRWENGCGNCPDLAIYPAITKDRTKTNLEEKRRIFKNSRLYITAPSHWLIDRARQSVLREAAVQFRVIHNGIDLDVFKPTHCKSRLRSDLQIDPQSQVLLVSGNAVQSSVFKDYGTFLKALKIIRQEYSDRPLEVIVLGGGSESTNESIRTIPFIGDPIQLARYYQVADIYLHAAKADTFPTTIIEALACGTPVVATSVGGIPEQVRGFDVDAELGSFEKPTGVLVKAGEPRDFAKAVLFLLHNPEVLEKLSKNAADDAAERFGLDRQVNEYLNLYEEMLHA